MRTIGDYWDTVAEDFDREPDHGLGQPGTRAAWAARLAAWVPGASLDVLDLGCGTGTLSVLLAERGHRVTGLDLSSRMAGLARAKLSSAGFDARVLVGDAADPPVRQRAFDVILARHVLWTLPDPLAVLRRWVGLLRPQGRLVLVEGRWGSATAAGPYSGGTGELPWLGGVGATVLTAALAPMVARVEVEPLTDPELWGRIVHDERYAALARLA
jgi:SAM-dependent methyltransferase